MFEGLEILNQGVSRAVFSETLSRILHFLFLVSDGGQRSLMCPDFVDTSLQPQVCSDMPVSS